MLGIYTRLSKEDDASNSINNQLREAEQYVEDKKNIQHKIYNEGEGFSGTLRIKERPELNQMMKDIEQGIITSVWMRKQDRLARLGTTVLLFADAIIKHDVYLYFGDKGHVDLTDPIEMFHLTIMAGVDALKPAQQSKATKKAIKDNFAEGLTHGKRTYGYSKDINRRIIEDDEEADNVRMIYMLSLNGMSTQKIANKLNDDGIKSQYAKIADRFEEENIPLELATIKPTYKVKNKYTKKIKTLDKSKSIWKAGTIYGILTNKRYKGIRTAKDGTVYNNIPIIIEPHVWQKVNDNLKNNKKFGGIQQKHPYLLKGLIRCGKCGENFYGRTRVSKKDNFYMCSSKRLKDHNCGIRSINIDFLDNLIWNRLFLNEGIKTKVVEYFKNNETQIKIDQLKTEQKNLEKTLQAYQKQKRNTMRYSDEDASQILEEINADIYLTQNQLDDIDKNLFELNNINENRNDYLNDLTDIDNKLPLDKKTELINKYVGEITVNVGFAERNAHNVIVKLNLDAELNEMYIIDYSFRYMIDVSSKSVEVYHKKYDRMTEEQLEITKKEIYDNFVIDTDIRGDTLEDLEALKHEFD